MIADLTILPVGSTAHLATMLAEVLQEIRRSGVVYQLTGTTTCLEGSWDQIMDTARRCHEISRHHAPHIVTLLRIEDDIEGSNGLKANVASVEQEAGEGFVTALPEEPTVTVPLPLPEEKPVPSRG